MPDPAAATDAGRHVLIDVIGGKRLDDHEHVARTLREAVAACGATLLHIHTHRFSPQGVTAVAALAESHASLHTWPEASYAAADLFTCGALDPAPAIAVIEAAFDPAELRVEEVARGRGVLAG